MSEALQVEVVFADVASDGVVKDDAVKDGVAQDDVARVFRRSLKLERGATVADALRLSGIGERFDNLDLSRIGVFGRVVDPATPLRDGDRVEIYRALRIDPKEARRRRAKR